jgi:hypothetical protein
MKHFYLLILMFLANAAFAEDDALFESKVRPVLVKHCYECHSGEKTQGGLALDTKAGWEKGGDSGPAIVPGKPVHVHDLHTTMLHLMGFDHEKLTYRHAGRDYRLTDVEGHVVKEVLA